jgi:VanZ family protein
MHRLGRYPWAVILIVLLAVVAVIAGHYFDLWRRVTFYDEIVQGLAIFALSLLLGVLALGPILNASGRYEFWVILTIASIGLALGALWEVTEWTYRQVLPEVLPPTIPRNVIAAHVDTIVDLLMSAIGGVLGGWLAYVWKARRP